MSFLLEPFGLIVANKILEQQVCIWVYKGWVGKGGLFCNNELTDLKKNNGKNMHERKNFHTPNLENQTTKLTSNLKQQAHTTGSLAA